MKTYAQRSQLIARGVSVDRSISAYLVASREFTSVHTLALLRLADAVGGRSVGDGQRNLFLRAAAHVALAAHHGGCRGETGFW